MDQTGKVFMSNDRFFRYFCFAVIFYAVTSMLNYLFFTLSLPKEVVSTVAVTVAVIFVERWQASRSSAHK